MRFDNKEIKIHLKGLIKYTEFELTNLLQLQKQLRKVLSKILCDLPHAGDKNHAYFVIDEDTWKEITGKEVNNVWKDGDLVATPTHPGSYTASTIAALGIYEKRLQEFNLHYVVRRATINFIHNTYKESEVLLDLEDEDGNINKDPLTIIKYLWTHVPEREKEQEIVKIENTLNDKYNSDKPVQRYFKNMQTTRNNLRMLNADPLTPKMIRQAVCAFKKHAELEKLTEKWHDKDNVIQEDWNELKKHFSKGIRNIANNPATKKSIGYANMAQ